ncbi:dephospho-CoA kinase domain-containing protein-like [Gigantopelta aegis]|uniref:dephospho-CoA kinase domain-containing protein-like n=1 Tax=Gigantopelta aegis TaxID=1735272 RepID=UPI001B88B07F|nr:dephospho-CoA kinase domain-containing protein-like [Gigantopelta aegis]
MFLVGLTGGIATGKSTVCKRLIELGCPVIDADQIARDVVLPGKSAWYKIRSYFGPDVFYNDGMLNREKLAHIIFSDEEKRKALNSMTHPAIFRAMLWEITKYFLTGYPFVVMDSPLLFENEKMLPYVTYIVVVSCSDYQQHQRLMSRNNLQWDEADQRISTQMAMSEKCKRATYIIDNSGTIEMTEQQVTAIFRIFQKSRAHWRVRTVLSIVAAFILAFLYLLW